MDFISGYAVDMNAVERVCEWLSGRMANAAARFHLCEIRPSIVRALRSEMVRTSPSPRRRATRPDCGQNVYLAYLGHLRLDGWAPLPPADPFTLLLKRVLEDEDVALLRVITRDTPLPPSAGLISPLSEEVFPKWWLDPNVLSPEWQSFDLGEHICNYHAYLLNQVRAT